MISKRIAGHVRFKNDNGFTLIEILIAMSIFLIGFLAVGSMQISAVNGNASARMRTDATVLATDVVEQLMKCPFNPTPGILGPYDEASPLAAGFHPGPAATDWFADGAYDVQWEVVDDDPVTNAKTIEVVVRWQKESKNLKMSLSNNQVLISFVKTDTNL